MRKGLEWAAGVFCIVFGFAAGVAFAYVSSGKADKRKDAEIRRCKEYFNTLNQWLYLRNENISLADWLLRRGCQTVAVYGLGELGRQLCRELYGTGVCVKYGLDRNAGEKEADYFCGVRQIAGLEQELGHVDAVIVTLPHAFQKLEGILAGKFGCPVLDLERVLFEAEQDAFDKGNGSHPGGEGILKQNTPGSTGNK